jgi:hypothetical protein
MTFTDECVYEGDFADGWPHGRGIMSFNHGLEFAGEWVDGDFKD